MRQTGIVIGIVVALLLGTPGPAGADTDQCRARCYEQKSTAYQRCRTLPPSDRKARSACFQKADAALAACLKSCK